MPAYPAEEVAELVGAHIISTSYPRRSKALKETTDATITSTAKDPAWSYFYMHGMLKGASK